MADIEERIYDLTPQAVPDDTDVFMIDNAANVEPKSITFANLISPEETSRTTADNNIIAGSGLESDGHLNPIPASNYLKNADFTAAGLAVSLKNGLNLLDSAIINVANAAKLSVQVSLSSAEILNIHTIPLQKVSAPSLNYFYQIDRVLARLTYIAPVYVTAAANGIYLRYTSASDFIAHIDKAFVESAADNRYSFKIENHKVALTTGLEFYAPDADIINGASKIDVIIEYMVRPDFTNIPSIVPTGCCVTPVNDTFVNADLSALGNMIITHSLGTTDVMVFIQDQNGASVATTFSLGNEAGADTTNTITVPIGLGIAGTWSYFIIGKTI